MSDTKQRRLDLWLEQAELKETNYRDPATDEYEYDGTLWSGKHLICRFEEDCEDAPRLFLNAYNTANEVMENCELGSDSNAKLLRPLTSNARSQKPINQARRIE